MKSTKIGFLLFAALSLVTSLWAGEDAAVAREVSVKTANISKQVSTAANWSPPVIIASEAGHQYLEKVVAAFHPSGMIYVVFEDHDLAIKKRSIKLYKYDGIGSTLVKNISETNNIAYEADMVITADGWIHIAWAEGADENADTQYIKYRYFDGSSWSPIATLRTMTITGTPDPLDFEKVDDVRLAVDENHNVFIVNTTWPMARILSLSKYGDRIYLDAIPIAGRSKHPSVAVDANFVHMTWVQLVDREYTIQYARRENRAGLPWSTLIRAGLGIVDRPMVRVNKDNVLAHIYLKTNETKKRDVWYRSLRGNTFSAYFPISGENPQLYHPPDVAAYDNNNMLFFVQVWAGGVRNYYNWYKNGIWSGLMLLNELPCTKSYGSPILNPFGTGAIAYSAGGSIQLSVNGPLTINTLPVAVINVDKETLFWGETINMNSNGSNDPDGSIVAYEWKIVQDNATLDGASVSYAFNKSYNKVKIRLTAIDNKGGRGVAEKIITVNALYTAPSTVTKKTIKTLIYNKEGNVIEWIPNPKNEQGGYTIDKYRIFRKTADSDWLQIGEVGADRRSFADVGIEAGKTYFYAVAAGDTLGRFSPYNNY